MMKFAWIQYGKLLTEQLPIMSLSSTLKSKGIDSVLIYSSRKEDIIRRINDLQPDIIGYSLMYGSHFKYIELSKQIRQIYPKIFQIAGGPFTTFYPQAINDLSVDAIGTGEADISLPNLINRMENKQSIEQTLGFRFRVGNQVKENAVEPLLEDLDVLPFPDRKLFYDQDNFLKNQEFKSFLSSRGCPYPCTYCFNHKFNQMYKGKGRIVRRKSVDYFIEEIKSTKLDYGCQFAIFEDDIFVLDINWLEDFTRKFKDQINIPYICYLRADLVNQQLLKLLKESGAHIIRMAIETGSERLRNTILKRNMDNEAIVKASDLIHQYGLKLSVSNMIGLPTETLEDVNETLKLNTRVRPDHPTIQFFMPYPNMELSEIAITKGYFKKELLTKIPKNTWRFTPLIFDRKTKRYMEKIQKIFALIVRYPFLRRLRKVLFILPDQILYALSVVVKIIIVQNYFPRTKVKFTQRLETLSRFMGFYG